MIEGNAYAYLDEMNILMDAPRLADTGLLLKGMKLPRLEGTKKFIFFENKCPAVIVEWSYRHCNRFVVEREKER